MVQQKTLCFFNKTLFTRLNNRDFSYMGKKNSKKLSQELDEITEKDSFAFYYLNNLPFIKGNLIVIPNPYNESEYFIFNYFERNNLFYVQTLSMNDYLGIIKHLNMFKNELKKIEEEGN